MPKHTTDLIERGATAQRLSRQRMAKDMSPCASRFHPSPIERFPHQNGNGSRSHERREGRVVPDEDVASWAGWPDL